MSNLLETIEIVSGKDSYDVDIYDAAAHASIGIISDLQTTDKSNVVAAINENHSRIDSLADGLTVTNERVDDLASGVSILNANQQLLINPKYIFIGDSYGGNPTASTSWIDLLINMLGLSSGNYYDCWEGGSCFTGTDYPTFLEQLQTLAATMTSEVKNQITNIVVAGGYNDAPSVWGTLANLNSAISSFVSYCNTTFPNAKVQIGMIGRSNANNEINDELLSVYQIYSNCTQFGAEYLNGVENCLCYSGCFQNDGIHPTSTGALFIAMALYNAIKHGTSNLYTNIIDSVVTASSGVNLITFKMQQSVKNDTLTIALNNWNTPYNQITLDTPLTVGMLGATLLTVGTITNGCCLGGYKERTTITTIATLIDSASQNYTCPIDIIISNNYLFIRFYPDDSISNVSAIFIPNISKQFTFIEN